MAYFHLKYFLGLPEENDFLHIWLAEYYFPVITSLCTLESGLCTLASISFFDEPEKKNYTRNFCGLHQFFGVVSKIKVRFRRCRHKLKFWLSFWVKSDDFSDFFNFI